MNMNPQKSHLVTSSMNCCQNFLATEYSQVSFARPKEMQFCQQFRSYSQTSRTKCRVMNDNSREVGLPYEFDPVPNFPILHVYHEGGYLSALACFQFLATYRRNFLRPVPCAIIAACFVWR